MNVRTPPRLSYAPLCGAALWISCAAGQVAAQSTPAPDTSSEASGAANAAPAADAIEDTDETIVVLDPFVVSASEDADSYRATATLAGTRIRTNLGDVGSSIQVVTSKFMQDTNSTKAEELLVYTTNTEVAGQGGNFLGMGDGPFVTDSALNKPVSNTRVRGLAEADNTRDFFLSDIPWDSYNVGRVDLQRGPNSILFGIGSPAGIVNSSLNVAAFKDAFKFENQLGSFGSVRFTLDANKVIIPDELALRVDLLSDETKYRQDPAFRDDKRIYVAGKWDPGFLNKGSAHTAIRVNYEDGEVESNMPRYTPPIDTITPWFSGLNKATYDGRTLNNGVPSPHIGPIGNRVYDGVVTTFSDGVQGISYPTKLQPYPNTGGNVNGANPGTNGLKGIATTDLYARQANLAGAGSGLWKARSITDPRVFDFHNNLVEGPNKSEFNNFNALSAALTQTFANDKLGFELAFDSQEASWGNDTSMANDGATLTVDINNTLLNGQANLNVGRPLVVMGGGSAGVYRQTRTRDTIRATAFGELDFREISGKDSALGKILGRNTFTVLGSRQTDEDQNQKGPRWYLPSSFAPNAGQGNIGQASRDNIVLAYVGDPLTGASDASVLRFKGLKKKVSPVATTINVWNNQTNVFENIPMGIYDSDNFSDADKTYTNGFKSRNEIESAAFIWQGYWFGGNLVPLVGIRKDSLLHQGASAPGLAGVGGAVNIHDPAWTLPTEAVDPNNNPRGLTYQDVSGTSNTYSLVAKLPQAMREKIGGLGFSVFANQSENFKPESRRDIMGTALPAATGETKEYGFTVSAFEDRLTFKAVHFDTKVQNATMNGALAGFYLIGANEWWGGAAIRAQINNSGWQAGNFGTATNGGIVTWQPDSTTVSAGTPIFMPDGVTYTQAALDQTRARIEAAHADWFANLAPSNFQAAWEFVSTADGVNNRDGNYNPSGMALTGTTRSEGWEFEVLANPVKGLDVSFNASNTTAQRSELAAGYTDWILQRWEDLQGPMGDIRIWGGASGGETTRSKFRNETYGGYLFFNALQGADVPEINKWRFNVISNYSFQEGALNGANIGGSYRWTDPKVIGYYSESQQDPISGGPIDVADLDRPIKGESESAFDLWLGYGMKLGDRVKWRIQLNVRNLFADEDLIPTTTQPDGSIATYRIPEPRTWTLTNTFEF